MQYSQQAQGCQPVAKFWVDRWLAPVAQFLWPSTCVLCRRAGQAALDLCSGCEQDLVRNTAACSICAQPLEGMPTSALICGHCLRRRPRFDASIVPFRYAYPLDHLVRCLKYRRELACGRVLGDLLGARIVEQAHGSMPQLLIPVPLGLERYRERGYNQATEIALRVSRLTRVPMSTSLVERRRETAEQAQLHRKARRRNVRGAFVVTRSLKERHVAIVDDVVTTASTANELARVLRRAGVQKIEVWAVARAAARAK